MQYWVLETLYTLIIILAACKLHIEIQLYNTPGGIGTVHFLNLAVLTSYMCIGFPQLCQNNLPIILFHYMYSHPLFHTDVPIIPHHLPIIPI